MGRRTILVTCSVLLAGVGTLLVFLYAQNAERRAVAGQTLVSVLFAAGDIPAGTPAAQAGSEGKLVLRSLPQRNVPDQAIRNAADLGANVALSKIFKDEIIVVGKFGAQREVSGLVPIPDGKMAITVGLTDPQRVAGLVQPLSLVTVFATVPDSGSGGGDREVTRVLLPEVQVLRVGQEASVAQQQTGAVPGGVTEEIPKQILTLAVDTAQAQKLIYAQKNGQLYLALKGPKTGNAKAADTTAQTLFRVTP
jgi:pilus assembly protein CpaB